jgi:hypothetical protein
MNWRAVVWGTALATAAVGCDSGGRVGGLTKTTADVRVVNASSTTIDLLQDQAVASGNAAIGFGGASQCMTVQIISHGLSVRQSGLGSTSSPLPSFTADEKYVVIVTASGGAFQLLSLRNGVTPAAGKAAIRFVNVSGAGGFDIFVTDPGAPLGAAKASAIATGAASAYFDVPTTSQQIRLAPAGTTAVAFDVGNVTLAAGARAIVVLAPPATGTTVLRPFVFQQAPGSC